MRLAAQRLSARPFEEVTSIVRWMLALQAQDFPGACWALGLRSANAVEADVLAALAAGSIVRSWPMRGTLHFTPAEDLGWMLSLTSERLLRGAASRRATLGLEEATLTRSREVVLQTLSGGLRRTRGQMMELFEEHGISTQGQRGYHLLWHLAQSGTLCFGPLEGSEQTFVLLDEWVKNPRKLRGEEALREFAVRYFTSHGPATLQDFAWWSSLTMKEARQGVAAAGKLLASLEVEGITYLLSPEALEAPDVPPVVLALPGFDELLLGYQERSAVLPEAYAQRIVPGGNGMFLSSLLVGGRIAGLWKRTQRARHLLVEVIPFESFSKKEQGAVTQAIERYGVFTGKQIKIEFRAP